MKHLRFYIHPRQLRISCTVRVESALTDQQVCLRIVIGIVINISSSISMFSEKMTIFLAKFILKW